MSSDAVVCHTDGGLMTITINRPAARNAINAAVARGLAEALQRLDADSSIKVGILTGAQSTFCSGMDLKAFVAGENVSIEGRGFAGMVEALPKKPLIAAVEGYALAGGFELTLACDLIVAGSGAQFGIPEVKRGLIAGAGALLRLPRQMPYRVAMELALTGSIVSAQRLFELGMVNKVVKDGEALSAAIELGKVIAENSPLGVAGSKAIIQQSEDWSTDQMFARQSTIGDAVFHSQDAKEGAIAFAEKRKPVWKGL